MTLSEAEEPLHDPRDLYGIVGEDLKKTFDMREVGWFCLLWYLFMTFDFKLIFFYKRTNGTSVFLIEILKKN